MSISVCALAAVLSTLAPEKPVAAGPSLHNQIDKLIAAGHPNYAKEAAPIADDAEFLRRVYLDLAGTLPTTAEARAFLAASSPDKREQLIDKLLTSPGYARRMANVFDVAFMERRGGGKVAQADWMNFLRESFTKNKPYDKLTQEILAADGVDPKARGPAKFFLDREFEPNLVVRDVSRVFLGKNLQCAQCHDHPLIDDYKQEHFFGLLAFLNRSFLFPKADAPTAVIAEKAEGEVSFTSVFDKSKAQKSTAPRLPGGKPIDEPKPEKGKEYTVAPAKDVRPVPAFSRRAQLAKAITAPDNRAFARTAVNRIWAMMMGRGIVDPVDLDHTDNPPSHPELLDFLTDQFVANKYNVRWLVREIARSKTYQRSSEVPAKLTDVPADRYLVGSLKPLSPEQLAYAALQATGRTDVERAGLKDKLTEEALDVKLTGRVDAFRRVFAGRPGEPEGFSATLDQTLFLKHDAGVRDLLKPTAGNLTDRLAKLTDPNEAADELFLSMLIRLPTAEERADVKKALAHSDRPAAIAEVVWSLLASTEFRFNH